MKVSLNIVKQYTEVTLPTADLVAKINQQLGEVEAVSQLGSRYRGATIVKIVSCDDHPDADRLHVCMIDDGGATPDVERGSDGLVQVVCGAPNARAGITVVWLPPGSTVPSSFADAEPFVLGSRPLRGVISHGMLASPRELGIGDNHDGILEIGVSDAPYGHDADVKPGASFATVFGLDDTIIDIENKMFTHRPDCFGVLGVAREIAGIQDKAFTSPDWYRSNPSFPEFSDKNEDEITLKLEVTNQAARAVPRLMAIAIAGVSVKPSPLWLQIELVRLGARPINNIVDVTNYVMLLTGQPLHAYDYDKLHGGVLTARLAQTGETVRLLNGKTLSLTDSDIVIADGAGPIGLAGVMGGADSEVSAETHNIVLECASFDMYAIRKTSMRHGLFTDAVTRFNKGQSPRQNAHILNLALLSIHDVAGGSVAGLVNDMQSDGADSSLEPVKVSVDFINQRLGLDLSAADIKRLLENVEFGIIGDVELQVSAPFWRTDIELPEDVVEEVGRLYGYDKLPRELPQRSVKPPTINQNVALKSQLRNALVNIGANEVLSYSFVNGKTLERAGQDIEQAFKLSNALSPDLQYYRLSVLPSLLEKINPNIKAGYDRFTLFEIGKGHNAKHHLADDDELPTELEFLDIVTTSKLSDDATLAGSPYYDMRSQLDGFGAKLGLNFAYSPITESMDYPVTAPFDQSRSAIVTNAANGEFIGMIGEFSGKVLKNFKLPAHTAAATLDVSGLGKALAARKSSYQALSRFPSIWQDICLRVTTTVSYAELEKLVHEQLSAQQSDAMTMTLVPIDIFQKPDEAGYKQITFRYTVSSDEKTMTDAEVSAMLDAVTAAADDKFSAVRV